MNAPGFPFKRLCRSSGTKIFPSEIPFEPSEVSTLATNTSLEVEPKHPRSWRETSVCNMPLCPMCIGCIVIIVNTQLGWFGKRDAPLKPACRIQGTQ